MPQQKIVITVNQPTRDPVVVAASYIDVILFEANKPCTLKWLRYDLIWADNPLINYDNRGTTPTSWWYGNDLIFQIYRQQPPTTNPIFPSRLNQTITFGHPMDHLICVRVGTVHKSPAPPTIFSFAQSITLPDGIIDGPIVAPAGTGDVGPLALAWDTAASTVFETTNTECGGTTVYNFRDTEKHLNIHFDKDDLLRLTGVYNFLDDVNTGQVFFGTIEFIIEF